METLLTFNEKRLFKGFIIQDLVKEVSNFERSNF